MGLSLIVKLVLVLVVMGSLAGIVITHDNKIRTAQKAKDASALLACQSNEDITNKANMTLQLSVHKIDEERQKQSELVQHWQGLWLRAQKVADDALDANAPLVAQLKTGKAEALAKAAAARGKMTCEETLAEIDKDSSAWAKLRSVLFPPDKSPKAPDTMRVK